MTGAGAEPSGAGPAAGDITSGSGSGGVTGAVGPGAKPQTADAGVTAAAGPGAAAKAGSGSKGAQATEVDDLEAEEIGEAQGRPGAAKPGDKVTTGKDAVQEGGLKATAKRAGFGASGSEGGEGAWASGADGARASGSGLARSRSRMSSSDGVPPPGG